jgi:hypothetical protein
MRSRRTNTTRSQRASASASRLGTSPLLLVPIVRYCGMLPVLFNFFVTRDVLDAVGYSGITFLTDERIEALVGWDSVVKLTGPRARLVSRTRRGVCVDWGEGHVTTASRKRRTIAPIRRSEHLQ